MSIILHYCCSLVWNMGLFTSAQLFNKGRNSRQTRSQFLVYRKKLLTFLIFDVGQLIFRDCKAGMVPSTLGMCRYISRSEIVCRGPKKFENPWVRPYNPCCCQVYCFRTRLAFFPSLPLHSFIRNNFSFLAEKLWVLLQYYSIFIGKTSHYSRRIS